MNVREVPLVFECEGSELVGVAHVPASPRARGLLFILAGASQYRAGMGRGQLLMARDWAAHGIPVMRFDHRGLGDSEGRFEGFRDLEADVAAALQAFRAAVPEMREVVLFGGCDGASACMINAWKFDAVTGMVMGNPWVHNETTGDQVAVLHFRQRILDPSFWRKFLRGGYDPRPALGTIARVLRDRLLKQWRKARPPGPAPDFRDNPSLPHLVRMREGLLRFKGDVLLLMSGRSLVSREFDVLVANDPAWQAALRAPRRWDRHDLPDADQAFSTIATRDDVSRATREWLLGQPLTPAQAPTGAQLP